MIGLLPNIYPPIWVLTLVVGSAEVLPAPHGVGNFLECLSEKYLAHILYI
jgi:hypothetical protein